jgi:hypothetical protein
MKKYLATFILSGALLFTFITAQSKSHTRHITEEAQTQTATGPYTATVKSDEARFTLPAPQRPEWKWRQPETKENAQEYRMDVSVKNGGSDFTFGFYLWKRGGAKPGTGSFSELLAAGQQSVFERSSAARGFSLVPDGGVNVSERGDTLLITISGRKNVARLFSGRPAYVTFKLVVPGEAKSNLIPVKYED